MEDNMNRQVQKVIASVLVCSFLFSGLSTSVEAKVAKPRMKKKLSVYWKTKTKLNITKVKKSKIQKTIWKTKSKKIRLLKKKKNSVVISGLKKGKATVTAKVVLKRKSGKRVYRLSCKITVKEKNIISPTAPSTVIPQPNVTDQTEATPTPTATADATQEPTPTPTATPTATPTPYIPENLPEPEIVSVPAKPTVNESYTDTVPSTSTYDLTEALTAKSVKDAYSEYFSIGAAINGTSLETSTAASPEMRQVMKRHFNSTTLSNLMKPEYLLDQEASQTNAANGKEEIPGVKFDDIVDNLEFCKQSGIKMRGHVLLWHKQTPEWFFREGFTEDGDLVDKTTMRKRMASYIQQVVDFCETYYPDVIYCWDVVNEAVETTEDNGYRRSNWYTILGKEYIADAFYYARKYVDEDVKLFYNDFNTFDSAKNAKIIEIIQPLKEAGLLDGVGMQSYLNATWPGVPSVKKAIENFAAAGLEIQITELTFRVPNYNNVDQWDYIDQGMNYQELMNMLIEMDTTSGGPANITNVTFFGLIDNPYSVFGQNPAPDQDCWARLFDENFKPKYAYDGVMDALTD